MNHINIYLLVLLGLLASHYVAYNTVQGLLIYSIPIIYFFSYTIRAVYLLFKSRIFESLATVLIGLLCILILIKIDYNYYNPLEIIVVLGAVVVVYGKASNRIDVSKIKQFMVVLSAVNFVLLITPDTAILNLLNKSRMLEWKPNLKWSDFPVKVDPAAKTTTKNLDYDALTSCTFLYKINNAYNYPPALIIAYMNKPESYRKDHILNNYEQLLEHEQGHFNMAKQHEEMAKDSIAKLWGKKVEEIDSTIKYFIGKLDREGSVYDSLTNHGLNTLQQREWTKKLKIL